MDSTGPDRAGQAGARPEALEEENRRLREELQQVLYVVSHDLQEPVRMVSSYVQLLQRRCGSQLDPSAQEFIGFAVDGAARLSKMLTAILDLSRVNTRGGEMKAVDSARCVEEARRVLAAGIAAAGATLETGLLPVVHADPTQLTRVFAALIDNALKFRRPDTPPVIRIEAEPAGHFRKFVVRDNGLGFPPEEAGRLFRLFVRLVTRAEAPGIGAGLALVRRVVERHGGTLGATGDPGHGAVFWFTLPAQNS
jgi:light-regulated signal transduction histidine kinase (bacteriophytochrome)